MTVEIMADTARLSILLSEALTIADGLELPIVAIHIDQALSQLAELGGNATA